MERRDLTPAQELKRVKREARALWQQVRTAAGHPRFTDPPALRSIDYAIDRCYPGVEWRDLESAIRTNGALEFCRSPWFLDSWARAAKADRERVVLSTLDLDAQERALRAAR